ncbi:MAG: hypothetical protein WDN06_17120 [Asticcacaulis sp.]
MAGVDDGGVDTVYTSVTWTLGAGFENAIASTTAAIGLTGNDLNNQITGGAGSNVLTGLGGKRHHHRRRRHRCPRRRHRRRPDVGRFGQRHLLRRFRQ